MYFPFLRGKQFELIMLNEVCNKLQANSIIPIIEPVKKNTTDIKRTITNYVNSSRPIILISNPQVGEITSTCNVVLKDVFSIFPKNNNNSIIGFIISNVTSLQEIQQFVSTFNGYQLALIHSFPFSDPNPVCKIPEIEYHIFSDRTTSIDYQNTFNSFKRILIKDGFHQMRNADYPEEEFFFDTHSHYKSMGFQGFGDFNIVGENYTEHKWAAYAIAIHLTYLRPNNDLWIKHFISNRTQTTADPAGKFLEALEKLIDFDKRNKGILYDSSCLKELYDLYSKSHYPGLGFIKKLSMRHHVELLSGII